MIETERLVLRRWRAEDAVPFFAMARDAEVMRYLLPMTEAECADTVTRMNALADSTGDCFWAVERRADGAFLGFCGIKAGRADTPIAGLPELGWRLARTAWGQGYAHEAASACIARAWTRGAARLVAITVPANTRSWGLMERLGMTRVADGDFDHPAVADGDPLKRHLTCQIDRP